MNDYRDFTFDPVNFADLGTFVEELHNKSMHYVPILDVGVAMRPWSNYSAYSEGVENNTFITINGEVLVA